MTIPHYNNYYRPTGAFSKSRPTSGVGSSLPLRTVFCTFWLHYICHFITFHHFITSSLHHFITSSYFTQNCSNSKKVHIILFFERVPKFRLYFLKEYNLIRIVVKYELLTPPSLRERAKTRFGAMEIYVPRSNIYFQVWQLHRIVFLLVLAD